MQPQHAKSEFECHLQATELQLAAMTPAQGVDAMLTFYKSTRADGCHFDSDGDMLLFQCGTYDWGDGEYFEFDVTRQLIFGDQEDENIWQLSLKFKFDPTDPLRGLDAENKWCGNLEEIPEFERFIRNSASFQLVANEKHATTQLEFECAG